VVETDFSELQAALAIERDPANHRRSSKRSGGFFHDVPLRVTSSGLLRLEYRTGWRRTVPGIEALITALKRVTTVKPMERTVVDLRPSSGATNAEQDQQIIELVERNDRFAAIKAVRKRYGMSLADAKQFVDDLAAGASTRK
jgi:hypothetical protein